MSTEIKSPAVFINKSSAVALVTSSNTTSVCFIDFTGTHTQSLDVFTKNYKPLTVGGKAYSVARAASKILTNKFSTPDESTIKILKGIINMESSIIALSPEATLIGRFADEITATDVSPEGTVLVTSPEQIAELFGKAIIARAMGDETLINNKKNTLPVLAEMLFNKYMGIEVHIEEPKARVSAAKKESGPKKVGTVEQFANLLKECKPVTEQDVIDKVYTPANYPMTDCTFKTALGLLTRKDARGLFKLDIQKGMIGGVLHYALLSADVNFDVSDTVKKSKKTKPVTAPETTDPDAEIDNSDEQLDLPLA